MCECLLKDKTKSWHCSNNGTRLTSLKNKFIKIFIIYYKFLVICKSPPIYVYIYGYLYVCQRDQQGQSKYMRPGSFAYFPMINWWAFWAFWWPWRTVASMICSNSEFLHSLINFGSYHSYVVFLKKSKWLSFFH